MDNSTEKTAKCNNIEKLDRFKLHQQDKPYTMLLNHVIQNIKDSESFMVWAYLASLPPDWIVIKSHIKNKFHFGHGKIKRIFSYLNRSKLIEYSQERRPDGVMGDLLILVLCGDQFLDNELFLTGGSEIEPAVISSKNTDKPPVVRKTARAVNRTSGFGPLQKKQNKKERKSTKKTKSFCDRKAENAKKHDFAQSKHQMGNEQKHIQAHEERKKAEIAPMPEDIKRRLGINKKALMFKT